MTKEMFSLKVISEKVKFSKSDLSNKFRDYEWTHILII